MTSSPVDEPSVGIFWYFDGNLLFDCTSVSQAEPYGNCLTHARGHAEYWTSLQESGRVPREVEYDEPPRGRVVFDKRHDRFVLMADACIRRRSGVIRDIMNAMGLPPGKTEVERDEHYVCPACASRKA